jgi:hypothetical protein
MIKGKAKKIIIKKYKIIKKLKTRHWKYQEYQGF